MKKSFLVLAIATSSMFGAVVIAQENLIAPTPIDQGDVPPQVELPLPAGSGSRSDNTSPLPDPAKDSGGYELEPIAEPNDWDKAVDSIESEHDYQLFGRETALLESSGTWLRRGFWFTEVDAVIMNRLFNSNSITLMAQVTGFSTGNPDADEQFRVESNRLVIGGSRPGAKGMPRLKLGRFLFRDGANHDHTAEFIAYGGAEWSQSGRLDANPNNNRGSTTLFVPNVLDGGNASFNDATSSQFAYNSRFNSFEVNYHVKARLQRDRMELEPNGQWVRRAQPSISRSWLVGVRYFKVSEDFDWSASGMPDQNNDNATETGNYLIKTDNDLIGTQVGLTWNYETARWSIGTRTKGGMFLNRIDVASDFAVTGGSVSGSSRLREDNLSFIGEAALVGKWHLRPNFSLRTALEILYVEGIGLAPDHINFVPTGSTLVASSGDPVFLGGSIGFEGYW